MVLEIGRVCVKTAGRESGRYCTVVKIVDSNFVVVTGPKPVSNIKRRRCSVTHLEPLPIKVDIKADSPDPEVVKAYEAAKVMDMLKLEKPSAEDLRKMEEARKEKAEKREEKAKEKEAAKADKKKPEKQEKAKKPDKEAKKKK